MAKIGIYSDWAKINELNFNKYALLVDLKAKVKPKNLLINTK